MDDTNAVELYRKHRPRLFKELLGQPEAVKTFKKWIEDNKTPHAVLFTGPSGVGKTTVARILANKLKCGENLVEINAAEERGIEMTRDINRRKGAWPMGGAACRVWILDECHRATGDAQSSLLKTLEDVPSHVYFFLCTTDPQKLLATIRTRCTEVKLAPLSSKDMTELIKRVLEKEKKTVPDTVRDRIIEVADGSARKALVLLHHALGLDTEAEQLKVILSSDLKTQAIEIARALINKDKWAKVAGIVKGLEGEDAETLRWLVLGYAKSVLLSGGPKAPRAFELICSFESNFYDSKHAGLARACWEVTNR